MRERHFMGWMGLSLLALSVSLGNVHAATVYIPDNDVPDVAEAVMTIQEYAGGGGYCSQGGDWYLAVIKTPDESQPACLSMVSSTTTLTTGERYSLSRVSTFTAAKRTTSGPSRD